MRRSHQISVAIFERACAGLSLTPAQYGVLALVEAHPRIDQTRLARALAFDKVTVQRVLKGLEERGLCQRERLAVNRRQRVVSLTPEGLSTVQLAKQPVQQAYERLLAPLSPEEQATLIDLLQRLSHALEGEARSRFDPLVP